MCILCVERQGDAGRQAARSRSWHVQHLAFAQSVLQGCGSVQGARLKLGLKQFGSKPERVPLLIMSLPIE